jgi:phosphoglycerate dehydrogenase-like enzyme/predicted dehydrogenase
MIPLRRPVRVLVVGAGPAAVAMHLPVLAGLRDAGQIELTIVCDIVPERGQQALRQFGFSEYSGDANEALQRNDIDAAYIFGSAQLHYEFGMIALQNGKHLFVEKPVAPSFHQALNLCETAKARGLIAVGGLNRRFYKSLASVRARHGRAGWRSVEVVFHKPEHGKAAPFGVRSWLSANGIHALDALVFAMEGLPVHLTAIADDAGPSASSVFSAVMSWSNGAQGVFLCNNSAGARREEYVFHGVAETYRIDEDSLTVEKDGTSTRTPIASLGDGVGAEHEAFLQAIRSGVAPLHSICAIAPSVFLAELIERGFSGPVEIPKAAHASAPQASTRESLLIANCTAHQAALTPLLRRFTLVAVEHVNKSKEPRPDIRAAIVGGGPPYLDPGIFSKLPNLSVIGVIGLSLARHAPETWLGRGVAMVNASDAYAQSVAEFALGLAILSRRGAFGSNRAMRAGGWGIDPNMTGLRRWLHRVARSLRPSIRSFGLEPVAEKLWKHSRARASASGSPVGASRDLDGAVVGIIGWGANAQAFAIRLVQAGARVLVYSEHGTHAEITGSAAAPASLAEVLSAEIVSLHRGLSPRTLHFLGSPELAQLRPGTVLINVARGALIEPQALIERLSKGDIFACLDTYEEEPLPASHPLRKLDNVFLTSHIAGGSGRMQAQAADEVVRKVIAHLDGELQDTVSVERLRNMT